MKIFPLTLVCFLVSVLWSAAQVSLELEIDQEQFLLNESLPVRVRITNRAGQPLNLGQEKYWITFSISSRDGSLVSPSGERPALGDLSLDPSLSAQRTVDLMPYFDLNKTGRYTVSASLNIPQWNEEIASKPKPFEIARGTKIWEQEFGVPAADGSSPEARRYALVQANYVKRLMLYVRVTDLNDRQVFKVFPAGPLVSFSRPETHIDGLSNLHVLFQTGARSFLYEVVSPSGELLRRQTYDYTNTRPVLRSGEDGVTSVAGGAQRLTANDLPPPTATAATNNVQTPTPKSKP
jgi:hypothetical protein